ncbi:MAG: methyltransferase domain-containing protein [Bdellovibrionota bacterium]
MHRTKARSTTQFGAGDRPDEVGSTLKRLRGGLFVSDAEFDRIYPAPFRSLSRTHWTPIRAAIIAAKYACNRPGARILDIGSGVGKFCIIGALTNKGAIFHGVEQRGTLVSAAKKVSRQHAVPGVSFFHKSAFDMDWSKYDAVYLYNPFWENIDKGARIDESVPLHEALLVRYVNITRDKLSALPSGARALFFNGYGGTVPQGYRLVHFDRIRGLDLTVWEKR